MAHIVFDLSRKEDILQFISAASGILATCELLTEEIIQQLEQSAISLNIHGVDYHATTIELISQRGGMGLHIFPRKNAPSHLVACLHCGHEAGMLHYLCPACSLPFCICKSPVDIGMRTFLLSGENRYQEQTFIVIKEGSNLADCRKPSYIRCETYGELPFFLCNPSRFPLVIAGKGGDFSTLPLPVGASEADLFPNCEMTGNRCHIGFSIASNLSVRLHVKTSDGIEKTTELGICMGAGTFH